MEESCLLACSSWLLNFPSYTTEDHLTSSATSHSELDPPTLIINQENAPQSCLQANLMEAVSQLKSLFPQMSRFVLTETNLHTLPAELLATDRF